MLSASYYWHDFKHWSVTRAHIRKDWRGPHKEKEIQQSERKFNKRKPEAQNMIRSDPIRSDQGTWNQESGTTLSVPGLLMSHWTWCHSLSPFLFPISSPSSLRRSHLILWSIIWSDGAGNEKHNIPHSSVLALLFLCKQLHCSHAYLWRRSFRQVTCRVAAAVETRFFAPIVSTTYFFARPF